ncbi:hypothetical protein CLV63_13241 [Murinocardiopsis flavida]|uniref:Uncharacterized protein n=1 Tax=Murinocardiopsis flavida TaxID=645275 RepID=A0A2P8CR07_9ACTN|nr:hypothetical protein [Murinocardiopsis flavida]PSK87386.1 hypothetical protein CLV63_13241 [Murinocardiopsis flavida]
MDLPPPAPQCPDCAAPLSASAPACPRCGLPLTGPDADSLGRVVLELQRVDLHRRTLAAQYHVHLGRLRAVRDARPRPAAAPQAAPAPAAPAGPPPRPRDLLRPLRPLRELTAHSVQNILLGLGGLLMVIAATVFTVVTWGSVGIGGRALILGCCTALTMAAGYPLLRRGMTATAETFGALGAALLVLDATALWWVGGREFGPLALGYAAAAAAVIAAVLALYPVAVPLRGPRAIAAVLAQLVLPFAAVGAQEAGVPGAALLVALPATALADVLVARLLPAGRLRGLVAVLAAATWTAGLALVAVAAYGNAALLDPGRDGLWAAAALLLAGAAALLAAAHPAAVGPRAAYYGAAAACWVTAVPAAVSGLGGPFVLTPLSLAAAAAAAAGAVAALPPAVRPGPGRAVAVLLGIGTACGAPAAVATFGTFATAAGTWNGFATGSTALTAPWGAGLTATLAAAGAGWALLAWARARDWTAPAALAALATTGLTAAGQSPYPGSAILFTTATAATLGCAWAADRLADALPDAPSPVGPAAPNGGVAAPGGGAREADGPKSAGAPAATARGGWRALAPGRSAERLVRLGATRAAARRTVRVGIVLAGTGAALAAAASLATDAAAVTVLAVLSAAAALPALFARGTALRGCAAVGTVAAGSGLTAAALAAGTAPPMAYTMAFLAVATAAVGAATVAVRRAGRPAQAAALDIAAVLPLGLAAGAALSSGAATQPWAVTFVAAVASLLALVAAAHAVPAVPVPLQWEASATTVAARVRLAIAGARAEGGQGSGGDDPDLGLRTLLIVVAGFLGGAALLPGGERIAAVFTGSLPGFAAPWRGAPAAVLPGALPSGELLPLAALAALAAAVLSLVLCVAAARALLPVPPDVHYRTTPRQAVAAAMSVAAGLLVPVAVTALAVPWGAALAAVTATAGALLLLSAASTGGAAVARAGAGLLLAVPALGWSLAGPAPTLLVLSALTACAAVAAGAVRPATIRTAAPVSGALAGLAALGCGAVVLTALAAAADGGHTLGPVRVTPQWYPYAALAVAAVLSQVAGARIWDRRGGQRYGLVVAGAVLAVAGLLIAPGPGVPILAAAIAAVVLPLLAAAAGGVFGRVLAAASGVPVLIAVAEVAARLAAVLVGPYLWLGDAWGGAGPLGAGTPAATALHPVFGASPDPTAPVAAALVATGAALLVRTYARWLLPIALAQAAVPVLAPWALAVPLPYAGALCWLLLVAAGLGTVAALSRRSGAAAAAGAAALWAATLAAAWSLAERPATLVVLAAIAVLAAIGAALARTVPAAAGATAAAVLATGGFAVALPLALGQPPEVAGLAPIAVTASVAAVLGLRRLDPAVLIAAEAAAGVLGATAVLLSLTGSGRGELTAVALAALGVIALTSAPRAGRRWLGAAGGALLLAAIWVFLSAQQVTAPEPYAVVPALAALAAGWEWRRRRPGTGTWRAYGPGLALLLVPSLAMAQFVDPAAWRVGLLAAVSLAVALAGARWRLQSPLLIGGGTLLLVAAKSFGPPIWYEVAALPNWIPTAVVGIVLIAVGARYEQRLRDVRRLTRALRALA